MKYEDLVPALREITHVLRNQCGDIIKGYVLAGDKVTLHIGEKLYQLQLLDVQDEFPITMRGAFHFPKD